MDQPRDRRGSTCLLRPWRRTGRGKTCQRAWEDQEVRAGGGIGAVV